METLNVDERSKTTMKAAEARWRRENDMIETQSAKSKLSALYAKKRDAEHAIVISPADIAFDRRAFLKCLWGCEDQLEPNRIKCGSRGLSFEEAQATIHVFAWEEDRMG